jgi:pyruvate/2-oxoglutarate dehydrogenase complex dihydrolipoamide dehydrogenase (E3) component
MKRHFDSLIVGAGQAGIPLAGRLSEAGCSVALIERERLGGTCVNTGCTPTKTMIASAYMARAVQRAHEYGVVVPCDARVDIRAVITRKNEVVAASQLSLDQWVGGMTRCSLIKGDATFIGEREMSVNGETLTADRVFLNVGTRPTIPAMPGVSETKIFTSDSILEIDELPKHLVIVGGGYVGLEFGQMFRRFGSQITIVEMGDRLLAHEDRDVSEAVTGILGDEGVDIRTGAECIAFSQGYSSPTVHFFEGGRQHSMDASHVLVAVGRTPNTDSLNLGCAMIDVDARGFIVVNEHLETSAESVWALGDCNGKGAFTHTAYNDYEIVASNLLDDKKRRVCERIQAHALYIDPPLAQIGMTEAQVSASGKKALMATRSMGQVGRAVEKGESKGFMKVLVDAETRTIMGASILGVGADEAIHGMLDIMYAGMPYTAITQAVHIHPTVSELIPTLLEDLKPLQ